MIGPSVEALQRRHDALGRRLASVPVDVLVVSHRPNIGYLSHFFGSAGYLVYSTAEKRLTRHIDEDLSKIAADKARRIEAYFIERRRDGITLSRAPWVIDALEQLNYAFHRFGVGSPAYRVINDRINTYFPYYREAYGYDNLHFISANGDVVFSVVKGKYIGVNLNSGPDKDSALAKVVGNANMLLQAENSSFSLDRTTGMPAAFVAAPIFEKKGRLIGTLALELSNRELHHLAEDYRDLGETGETIIGQRMNDMAVIVAPLRHDPEATFRRRVPLGSAEAQALQEAVQGKSGRGVVTDYRGKEVLAVWRYLPNARYGVVVKIDAAEMLAPIRDLRNLSLITGSVTVLLAALIALFAAKSFSVPIKKLTQAAESIAQGDLSRRIDAPSHDEIGQLANTFNKMAARLQERTEALNETAEELRFGKENLERIVQERTSELRNQQEYYQSLAEQLQHKTAELERANKIKDEFLSVMSHELRTPLSVVIGYGTMLREQQLGPLTKEQEQGLDVIQRNSKELFTMIDSIMNAAKIETGSMTAEKETVSLVELFAELKVIYNFPTGKKIRFEWRISEALPLLWTDARKLRQSLTNLINNAVKFTDEGSIVISAEEKLDEHDGCHRRCIEFRVSDSGIGIPAEECDKIFERFHQVDSSATRSFEGVGLGLYIVKSFTEMLNGRVSVSSEVGHGSTFTVQLPCDTIHVARQKWRSINEESATAR